MEFKVKKDSLYTVLLLFLIVQIGFVNYPYIKNISTIHYIFILLLGFLCVVKASYFIKSTKRMPLLLVLFIVFVAISGFVNRNQLVITHTFVGAIGCGVFILELYFVIKYVLMRKGLSFLINTLYYIVLFYVIVNDILILLNPSQFNIGGTYYFVGNKFAVSYLHFKYIMLLFAKLKVDKVSNSKCIIPFAISVCLSVFFSFNVGCMTGVVGTIFLVILFFIPEKILANPFIVFACLIMSALFSILYGYALNTPAISNFISNFLGRDSSLSGRVYIYTKLPTILKDHLLLGYGYGSSYEVWGNLIIFVPNSQNGLVDNVVEQGIIAVVCFSLFMIKTVFNYLKVNVKYIRDILYPILINLYLILLLGCVEITTDIYYITMVVIFYTLVISHMNDNWNEVKR